MSNDALKSAPVLILSNKSDMASLKPGEIVEKLGLHMLRGRTWNLQPCCGLTGEGITEGFEWLRKEVKSSKK